MGPALQPECTGPCVRGVQGCADCRFEGTAGVCWSWPACHSAHQLSSSLAFEGLGSPKFCHVVAKSRASGSSVLSRCIDASIGTVSFQSPLWPLQTRVGMRTDLSAAICATCMRAACSYASESLGAWHTVMCQAQHFIKHTVTLGVMCPPLRFAQQ